MLIAKTVIYPEATTDRLTLTIIIGSSEMITNPTAITRAVLDALHSQAETKGLISLGSDGVTTEITVQEAEVSSD